MFRLVVWQQTSWCVLCVLLVLRGFGCARRRDVVVMKNGDRITRRIKKLERSQLFIASLYVATPHFRRLTTSQRVEGGGAFIGNLMDFLAATSRVLIFARPMVAGMVDISFASTTPNSPGSRASCMSRYFPLLSSSFYCGRKGAHLCSGFSISTDGCRC